MGEQILVGGAIPVGEWTQQIGDELFQIGAAMARGGLKGNAVSALNQRLLAFEKEHAKTRALAPILKLSSGVRAVTAATLRAGAVARVQDTRDYLEQATHVIPVCFDNVGATSSSGTATIASPHDQPWRVVAIHTNDSQCTGIRFTSLKFGNTEHVVSSNVTFTAGSPTSAGIDAAAFSGKLYRALKPQFQYRPWGLGKGGWIRSDGHIVMQVYNPGASAASLNVSVFVQSSPCGEKAAYDPTFAHPMGSDIDKKMWRRLTKGLISFWPRSR